MNVAAQEPEILAAGSASHQSRILRLLAFVLAAVALLVIAAPHAAAQGCAMCYQNAASSGAQGRAALRHGILVLLVPALSLFLGVFLFIYCRRDSAGFPDNRAGDLTSPICHSAIRPTKFGT